MKPLLIEASFPKLSCDITLQMEHIDAMAPFS